MNLARLMVSNATRNPLRSGVIFCCSALLAGLPFAISLVSQGANAGLQKAMDRMGADLLVIPENLAVKVETALLTGKPFPAWMPAQTLPKVAAIPGVAQASPQLYLATLSGASCCSASELFIVAYDPQSDFTLRPWLRKQLGRELQPFEAVGGSQVYATDAEGHVLVYGTPLRIAGNLARSGTGLDRTLFLTFDTARELAKDSEKKAERPLSIPPGQISAVLVKLQSNADPGSVANLIEHDVSDVLAVESPNLMTDTRKELAGAMRVLYGTLFLVWALCVCVAAAIFTLAAHERRRELGVLRALGASSRAIFALLMGEATLLAIGGAGAGIAVSLTMIWCFSDAIIYLLNLPFLFPSIWTLLKLMAGALAIAAIGVAAAAFGPVWRASQTEPALAMRE